MASLAFRIPQNKKVAVKMKSNFIVEKLDEHFLSQVVKVNIHSDKLCC